MTIPYLIPILGFLFVFGLVVLVHEVGHFVFAKACDVEVDAFSIGMGPNMGYQWGETEYRLSLIPIGGYVSMEGEDPEEAGDNPRAFYNKSITSRLMILLAGCLFNFLLGYVIFASLGMLYGDYQKPPRVGYVSEEVEVPMDKNGDEMRTVQAPAYGKLKIGDRILEINGEKISKWQDVQVRGQLLGDDTRKILIEREGERLTVEVDPVKVRGEQLNQPRYIMGIQPYYPPRIGRLRADGQASEMGLMEGDRIKTIDDQPVRSWPELIQILQDDPGEHTVGIERDGKTLTRSIDVPPLAGEVESSEKTNDSETFREWLAGMAWAPPIHVKRLGFIESFRYGYDKTIEIIVLMYETVVGLVNQQVSPKSLAGPVGIAQMTTEVSRRGMMSLLYFTAFFSINLGVINLLPIPALDGGHVLLTMPEILTGKPLPERAHGVLNYFGIILLLGFIIYVTKIDLCRYEWFNQYFMAICQ